MSIRRRTYPEIVENLLTHLTGGVSAEAHPYPSGNSEPQRIILRAGSPTTVRVVSIHGSVAGEPHRFRAGSDYRLLDDGRSVEWAEAGDRPDAGTLVHVNYLTGSTDPSDIDLHVGSVVRTLAESIALELARVSAQLEATYRAGFIDTATGASLDKVVALLGIDRIRGSRAVGEIEFTRSPAGSGEITIPAGTRVRTAGDIDIEYATTATVTMHAAQTSILAPARDLEANDPLPADALVVLPAPIAGIADVTNPAPTALPTRDENDRELRVRAKNFLHGSERATLAALRAVFAREQITADITEVQGRPGMIEIAPHADSLPPDQLQRLRTAIDLVRPAGVHVELLDAAAPRRVDLQLLLTSDQLSTEADLRAAQRTVRDSVAEYFAQLPVGASGSLNALVGRVLAVPVIQDVQLLAAAVDGTDVLDTAAGVLHIAGHPTVLGELRLVDPQLATSLVLDLEQPGDVDLADRVQIEAALTSTIAALNESNDRRDTPLSTRTLSFGKLLLVTPLPNKPAASLADHEAHPGANPLPTAASVTPYVARFRVTLANGQSYVLEADDDRYVLTPFERLGVQSVVVEEIAAP